LKTLPLHANIVIHCKKHSLVLKPGNQADYVKKRGNRGKLLPRGYRIVEELEVRQNET
jgi:topoisomerase-4 subunit A